MCAGLFRGWLVVVMDDRPGVVGINAMLGFGSESVLQCLDMTFSTTRHSSSTSLLLRSGCLGPK